MIFYAKLTQKLRFEIFIFFNYVIFYQKIFGI